MQHELHISEERNFVYENRLYIKPKSIFSQRGEEITSEREKCFKAKRVWKTVFLTLSREPSLISEDNCLSMDFLGIWICFYNVNFEFEILNILVDVDSCKGFGIM